MNYGMDCPKLPSGADLPGKYRILTMIFSALGQHQSLICPLSVAGGFEFQGQALCTWLPKEDGSALVTTFF